MKLKFDSKGHVCPLVQRLNRETVALCTKMTSGGLCERLQITFRDGLRFDLRDYLTTMISSAMVKSKS